MATVSVLDINQESNKLLRLLINGIDVVGLTTFAAESVPKNKDF